ncbi:MAG: glycosyltransferase family 2 protein [Oscillospiraceae bacterium]|nr:glycosyltransferase family 2 protein [Oscillospiraceae bacterium]
MERLEKESVLLTILMPCRNEAATVAISIREAAAFLEKSKIRGEILVVDNGSTDDSAAIAERCGARVITQPEKGYGNALRTGLSHSWGSFVILGDCDTTYDFLHLEEIYGLLSAGAYDMVIGNRFAGGMEKGSMPLSHKWGVRFLSWLGRKRLHTDIYDFHCGLRGLSRAGLEKLDLKTSGMEFATEMIAQAVKAGLSVGQVPVRLRKCTLARKSKLRTLRDGLRHLVYIGKLP